MKYARITPFAVAGAFALSLAVAGCAAEGDKKPGLAPVPSGLEPRPVLNSVPADAVRVAVFQGGGDISYDLVEGQRYFLVSESSDKLLSSDVADEDGEVSIGEDGATFDNDSIWEGTIDPNDQIGLYVSRTLETP